MNIRRAVVVCGLVLCGVGSAEAQCSGRVTEDRLPPAVRGMVTADGGFTVRYWAWDDLNHRRGGRDLPVLLDVDNGILLTSLDWAFADVCQSGGPVERTAVLFEALGEKGFGRWALVNLGAGDGGDIDVDLSQREVHPPSSRAVPVPSPRVISTRVTDASIEVRLGWSVNWKGEILSDLRDGNGQPLPSIRGFALYIINAPVPTARPWDWTRGRDVEADAVNGYSTDTGATLVLPRSLWHDIDVRFAVALTFDGNGDADGEDPRSRSVHGTYLGIPSTPLTLPPAPAGSKRARARGARVVEPVR